VGQRLNKVGEGFRRHFKRRRRLSGKSGTSCSWGEIGRVGLKSGTRKLSEKRIGNLLLNSGDYFVKKVEGMEETI